MNNKKDILDELKSISPALFALKENDKKVEVPNGYFEQLVDDFFISLNSTTSILTTLKKEIQTAPIGYFDTFGDTVIAKIKAEEKTIEQGKIVALPKPKTKISILFKNVAFAASIIGFVLFLQKTDQPVLTTTTSIEKGIASLTQNEIYDYMISNSQDFNLQQIKETVKPALEQKDIKIDIDKNEASDYLENHNTILEVGDASTDIF